MVIDAKTHIFVSYSRKDHAFVDKLEPALDQRGISLLIDRTDIYALEDWWQRIEELIVEADTIIFVVSPDAIASPICGKEVAFASSLHKRLAPIVCRPTKADAIPEELRRLNFVHFVNDAAFEYSADQLADALLTDISWIRKHTEIGAAALRWSVAGRPGLKGLLLRPPMLEEAEQWIATRPQGAPTPTDATRAFITESRGAETHRKRLISISLATGLLGALFLAVIALWQRGLAVEQRHAAETALRSSQERESLLLAKTAHDAFAGGNALDAERLSLQALPAAAERPFVAEAFGTLIQSFADQRLVRILATRPDGDEESNYAAHERLVTVSPDGKTMLADSYNGTLSLVDINSGHKTDLLPVESVTSLAFSPDGLRVLAADGSTASLIDLASKTVLFRLQDEERGITSAAFSPDGTTIVTAGGRRSALWNAQTGERLQTAPDHGPSGDYAQFSPDGRRVLWRPNWLGGLGAKGHTPAVWDLASQRVSLLQGHTKKVNTALFNPQGTQILTGSADGSVRLWDAATGQEIRQLATGQGNIAGAAFSSDGARVVAAFPDGTAHIWRASNGAEIAVLRGHKGSLLSAEFNPDGRLVVTSGEDESVRLWDASAGTELFQLNDQLFELAAARFSPDGYFVLTTQKDQSIRLWSVADPLKAVHLQGHEGIVTSIRVSPDGTRLATGSPDGTARIWDRASGRVLSVLGGNLEAIRDVVFRRDAILTATAHLVTIWNAVSGQRDDSVYSADLPPAISADGRRIALESQSGQLVVLDLDQKRSVTLPNDRLPAEVIFTADGTRLLALQFGDLVAWDTITGRKVCQTPPDPGWSSVENIQVSADGRFVWNKTGLWELGAECRLLFHVPGGRHGAFSADGSTLAVSTDDKTIKLWRIATGQIGATLAGHTDTVSKLAFSPDGRTLLSVGNDHTIRLWTAISEPVAVLVWPGTDVITGADFLADSPHISVLSGDSATILWIGATPAELIQRARETFPVSPVDGNSAHQ